MYPVIPGTWAITTKILHQAIHSMNLGSNDRNPTPGSNLVSNHSMNLGSNDKNPTPGSVAGPGAPALQQRP